MIVLDSRECIDDPPRRRSLMHEFKHINVPVSSSRLEFADAIFEGEGPSSRPVTVAFERKKLQDLANSMEDRKLSGFQLQGMWDLYDYVFLVIEGVYRPDRAGYIEHLARDSRTGKFGFTQFYLGNRPISYCALEGFILGQFLRGGVGIVRTQNATETAWQYASAHENFQKPWDAHTSHSGLYAPAPNGIKRTGWRRPTVFEKMCAQLPGVGEQRAPAVAAHFSTPRAMANAGEEEWREIAGVGKVIARDAVSVMSTPGWREKEKRV